MDESEFEKALDIWAQFFICPLFKRDAVDREINAVNSEFEIAKQNDWARKLFIMQETVMKKGHPIQQNGWGNKKMILEGPKRNGIDTYEVIKQWYPEHYSAKWMNLAIQSGLELDKLEFMVKKIFSLIPSPAGLEKPKTDPYTNQVSGFKEFSNPPLIKYIPINNSSTLQLWFFLPPVEQEVATALLTVPSYLIGDEGEGSALSKLKDEGLATSLVIGSFMGSKLYSQIQIISR